MGSITVKTWGDTIIVEDTGTGIDPEKVEMIFEPFYCADESKNREKSGFGLGLSIARNLAVANGYGLRLDKNYCDGCRFMLEKVTF